MKRDYEQDARESLRIWHDKREVKSFHELTGFTEYQTSFEEIVKAITEAFEKQKFQESNRPLTYKEMIELRSEPFEEKRK